MIPYYYGADFEYAQRRLSNTFVLSTSGKLLQIMSLVAAKDGLDVLAEDVASGVAIGLPASELDMTPLTLGYSYIQDSKRASFLSRIPARNINKQGLVFNAVKSSHCHNRYLCGKHLLQPVFNQYPTLSEALKLLSGKDKPASVPISRHFAISADHKIEYRGSLYVGELNEKKQPILYPKSAYLQQHLDSVIK